MNGKPAAKENELRSAIASLPGPMTVFLRGGRYEISEPIEFGLADSFPVTYRAYPGETPVIDGGTRIEGWRKSKIGETLVWVAEVDADTLAKSDARQLFVNGRRARRPVLPKEGEFEIEDTLQGGYNRWGDPGTNRFRCREGDMQQWRNLQDIDIIVPHFWVDERMPIESFDPDTRVVTCRKKSTGPLVKSWRMGPANYFLENVFEALSEPGECYIDKSEGKIYYVPQAGEELESIEAYIPGPRQLLRIVGDSEQGRYVEGIRFEGIAFCHAGWADIGESTLPETRIHTHERRYRGDDCAAGSQGAFHVPGVVYLRGARHCAIENCSISHVGWYGIDLDRGCSGIRVVGNEIADTGAGGIQVSGSDVDGLESERTAFNRVTDNHIHDGGHIYFCAVGVLARTTSANVIAHNHIHDLYYTGISVGWIWGYGAHATCNNKIEYNHIHDIGKGLLSDMGGIYTLGEQPGTVIRNNLIHSIESRQYGGWAIYPDEGSAHLTVENNVCYDTNSAAFNQHYGRENIVRNNIFAFGKETVIGLSKVGEGNSFNLIGNIIVAGEGTLYEAGYGFVFDREKGFDSRQNLIWSVSGPPKMTRYRRNTSVAENTPSLSWEEWQAQGRDIGSVVADPLFVDMAGRDFTLKENSPAFALGFKPIDLGSVGPRARDSRE